MSAFGWNWPNINSFINETWGWPSEIAGPGLSIASNIVVGTNPAYTVADFLQIYPNFGGNPLTLTGVITQGSTVVTGLQTTGGLMPGQAVASFVPFGANQFNPSLFPDGTTILTVDSNTQITLSNPALANGAGAGDAGQVAIFNQPWIPLPALVAYIYLASSCLVQARWSPGDASLKSQWALGMALLIAHYATLYLRATANPVSSAAQLAAAGLERGITVSKSAGGVSQGIQPVTGSRAFDDWGDLQETTFGVTFARMARVMGAGALFIF